MCLIRLTTVEQEIFDIGKYSPLGHVDIKFNSV